MQKLETERRFLVSKIDPEIRRERGAEIVQEYMETPPSFSFRVRVVDNEKGYFNRKDGSGESRPEDEITVDLQAAQFTLRSCAHTLQKTRYKRDGWEVDYYHGPLEGLIIAEYEKKTPEEQVVLPDWIYEAIDVTDSLTNLHLAKLVSDLSDSGEFEVTRDLLHPRLPGIVLTGGPCSGKSSVMSLLKQDFGDIVHCVPEVASIVIAQVGVSPPVDHPVAHRRFQRAVARIQRDFEAISEVQAIRDGKKALLLDRGVLDIAAYLPNGVMELVDICGTTPGHEYGRYDEVLCLQMPPEHVYEAECRNNPARRENYELARQLGQRVTEAWCGHPTCHLIESGDSWEAKVARVRTKLEARLAAV